MSVDDLATEEALLGDLTHAESSELDLYGDNENFDQLDSTNGSTEKQVESNGGLIDSKCDQTSLHDEENDDDLYNAVITERSSPNGDLSNSSHGNVNSSSSLNSHITGSGTQLRKFSCYVGNLTWWTTDQDLLDAVVSIGISDLIDVKFYENRQNGQSKGFALVSFNSESSVKLCMDKLVGKQIHSQQLVVLPYTKHSLAQFEAATRKPGERPQQQSRDNSTDPALSAALKAAGVSDMGKPGAPTFIGTFRIGMAHAPPPQQTPPMPQLPPPPHLIRAGPMGPPPGTIIIRSTGPPNGGHHHPPTILTAAPRHGMPPPPGPGHMIVPPPHHNRPPPGFITTQPGRVVGPPPNMLPHGMPPPGSHVNPNFYPNIAAAAAGGGGMPPQGAAPMSSAAGPIGANDPPLTEAEFEEIMNRNRTVSSSAISRAVSDASAGDFASAIETLVTAISLIRQSKVSHDDRCKILISSLQDTLRGIEAKSFGGAGSTGGGSSNTRRTSKERDRRSRSRDRGKRRRERSRTRSRSRDRFEEYSPRRRRY